MIAKKKPIKERNKELKPKIKQKTQHKKQGVIEKIQYCYRNIGKNKENVSTKIISHFGYTHIDLRFYKLHINT